jgi:drug/metabolite transporter (DMT)-like permease
VIYIVLSIFSATAILLLFRWMGHNGVNSRHAIMVNYAVAGLIGLLFFSHSEEVWNKSWFLPSMAMGVFFYIVFRFIAKTTQTNGVSAASIATKMSVLIPVLTGIFLLDESISWLKVIGISLGLVAVFFASKPNQNIENWKWLLLAFLGSGLIDAALKLFQTWSVTSAEFPSYITVIFSFAFLAGLAHHFTLPDRKIEAKSYFGGIMLGLVNFASLIFILEAISLPNWESSVIFPINNVGIVALSSLSALILFKENLDLKGWLSVILALCSICLLSFG